MSLPTLADADRELASRSLYHFVRLAWPHTDPNPFCDGWHIRMLCDVLEKVSRGVEGYKRVLINVPPGTGKSKITGIYWPAWDALFINPKRAWMYASFDSSLLNGDSTRLINMWASPWFRERWGNMLPVGRPNTSEIKTLRGGLKFNTSFGGRGTGRHCHIQVIDDPIKPRDASGGAAITGIVLDSTWETIKNTFASRRIDPATFARVMIMQRIHEDDPSGRALKEVNKDGSPVWTHVRIPMRYEAGEACECPSCKGNPNRFDVRTVDGEPLGTSRFGEAECDELEHAAGPDVWATQYQQRPSTPGGAIFKEEWIQHEDPSLDNSCTLAEARAKLGQKVQSWDLAFKDAESSDYVAGGHWCVTYERERNGTRIVPHFWLLDVVNERLSFTDTCNTILEKRGSWPSSAIYIEDKANGPACENHLAAKMPGLIELVTPLGSKLARAQGCAPLFANGQVHLPRDAPWFPRIKSTLLRFPRVRRDDEVDQLTQAILKLGVNSVFAAAMDAMIHARK